MLITFAEAKTMAIEALVVLGIIPGTNIQIGFLGWAALFSLAAIILYTVRRERRLKTIRFMLIRISLALTVRRLQRV
jgi:hypothetical protein